MASITTWFERFDSAEVVWCRKLNRTLDRDGVRVLFRTVSRLGDGVIWYSLMLLMPILYGWQGLHVSLVMALTGAVGLVLYKLLKHRLVRERPFIRFNELMAGIAPLDQYSFPSGHTLHAVGFTIVVVAYFPIWALVLVPFAILVALSRVVLGLHYPTDVMAGAVLGAGLAMSFIAYLG